MEKHVSEFDSKTIFRRNLKRLLNSSGKKSSEVARAVGVTTGNFCDWMQGRTRPKLEKQRELANYFGVQLADLIDDVNMGKGTISDEDQEILDLFHEVPKEKREFVLSMIRAAVDNL